MTDEMFECICDFCERASDHLWAVNGGAWAICRACYDTEYGGEEE